MRKHRVPVECQTIQTNNLYAIYELSNEDSRREAEARRAAEAARIADESWQRYTSRVAAFHAEQERELELMEDGVDELQARARAVLDELESGRPFIVSRPTKAVTDEST